MWSRVLLVILVFLPGCFVYEPVPEMAGTATPVPTNANPPGGDGILVAQITNETPSSAPANYTDDSIQANRYVLDAVTNAANEGPEEEVTVTVPAGDVDTVKDTLRRTGRYVRYRDVVIYVELLIED
jgi:hypothetical protein